MTKVSSSAIDVIMSRSTAIRLGACAPSREELEVILAAGARAPDHGRLQPWRFFVLEGEARAILAKSMGDIARANGESNPEIIAKAEKKAYRAPTIIVVAGVMRPDHKVPEIEQVLAVGASVQNMLIAAEALGLGAMWKTGAPAYDEGLKQALGLAADDHISAFVYLGEMLATPPIRRPVSPEVVWLDQTS